MPAHCAYQHIPPATHIVTVAVDHAERFREELGTEADAHDEAGHLLAHLIGDGWTTVMYRHSRIALP